MGAPLKKDLQRLIVWSVLSALEPLCWICKMLGSALNSEVSNVCIVNQVLPQHCQCDSSAHALSMTPTAVAGVDTKHSSVFPTKLEKPTESSIYWTTAALYSDGDWENGLLSPVADFDLLLFFKWPQRLREFGLAQGCSHASFYKLNRHL